MIIYVHGDESFLTKYIRSCPDHMDTCSKQFPPPATHSEKLFFFVIFNRNLLKSSKKIFGHLLRSLCSSFSDFFLPTIVGSNANYDRWLRDSVISYVTFTFLSFILERMILCDLFWLASLFTKVTSGKSSHFLFKSEPFIHLPKVSFDIWLMWLWLLEKLSSQRSLESTVSMRLQQDSFDVAKKLCYILCSVDDNLVG